jgi:hypothetical protein
MTTELIVTEGIVGMWHYHVSEKDKFSKGLCGAPTMKTSIPLKDWSIPFGEHFPKRPTWCKECDELKRRLT